MRLHTCWIDRHVVADEQVAQPQVPLQVLSRLTICAWIETSSALVGSSHTMKPGRVRAPERSRSAAAARRRTRAGSGRPRTWACRSARAASAIRPPLDPSPDRARARPAARRRCPRSASGGSGSPLGPGRRSASAAAEPAAPPPTASKTSVPSNSTRPPVAGVQPQQRPADRRLALQPDSPTSPSVSPGPMSKLTPSTARTWSVTRPSRPERTGKWVRRSRTERTGWLGRFSGIARSYRDPPSLRHRPRLTPPRPRVRLGSRSRRRNADTGLTSRARSSVGRARH
jgi:hypothetical protein